MTQVDVEEVLFTIAVIAHHVQLAVMNVLLGIHVLFVEEGITSMLVINAPNNVIKDVLVVMELTVYRPKQDGSLMGILQNNVPVNAAGPVILKIDHYVLAVQMDFISARTHV